MASTAESLPFQELCTDVTDGLPSPYLLFLGDTVEAGYAKTAFGLRDWARDRCVGELVLTGASVTTGLPRLSPAEAYARGARALVIGVANQGGIIPDNWLASLSEALEAGLDLISGMHAKLSELPGLKATAELHGRQLIDIRTPPAGIPIASGKRRTGKRLLTVGTDCALGKKYTALAITRAFHERGIDADFRATGQTGIMIAGSGIPMDAVVSDFLAGAAEMLSPDAPADHWDVIEGQGSLGHPSYAAVSLGLLHGSQPDAFVVCHDPARTTILGLGNLPIPSIDEVIELTIKHGRRVNPAIRCGGISLNTSVLDDKTADLLMQMESARLALPVADPIRGGSRFDALIDSCLG
jgi:uncharacterized NAD-dependent epimerase/dehydratase family protein